MYIPSNLHVAPAPTELHRSAAVHVHMYCTCIITTEYNTIKTAELHVYYMYMYNLFYTEYDNNNMTTDI